MAGEDYGYYPSPYADDATPEPVRFTPVNLEDVMRHGLPEPKLLDGLLYPGKVHSLTGPPESGKTIMSLRWAIEVMNRGGTVLHVDEEAGPQQTAALLTALGADPQIAGKRLSYLPFPSANWRGAALSALDQLINETRPVLSIWDSCAAIMSAAGLDENRAGDIVRFWSTVLLPIARQHNCAVLLIDHDAKSTEPTRYGRGSGAKLAAVDVAFKVLPLRHFSRQQDGLVKFSVTKDRQGFLHRDWRVKVSHGPLRLEFAQDTTSERPKGTEGMNPAAVKLASVLSDEPADIKGIVDRVVAHYDHGIKWADAKQQLRYLLDAGVADSILVPGKGQMWMRAGVPRKPEHTWRPSGPPEPETAQVIELHPNRLFDT